MLQLIKLTNDETIDGINENLLIEINNYVKSCVDFINYEIKGETEKYFQKFKNNSCFSYEKKIKELKIKIIFEKEWNKILNS